MTLIGVFSSCDATETNSAFSLSSSTSCLLIDRKLTASRPNSSTRSGERSNGGSSSPSATARIPRSSAWTGPLIERVSQTAMIVASESARTSAAAESFSASSRALSARSTRAEVAERIAQRAESERRLELPVAELDDLRMQTSQPLSYHEERDEQDDGDDGEAECEPRAQGHVQSECVRVSRRGARSPPSRPF